MNYTRRTVTSKAGLSQEEALLSLQNHPSFKPGMKIASIRRREDKWIATVLEPKRGGPPPFAPKDEEEEVGPPKESPEDEAEEKDEAIDGPPEGDEGPDGPPKPEGGGDEKAQISELLSLVHKLVDALGLGGDGEGPGGPDDLGPGPDGPPGPPPHAGPGRPPGEGKPLRPGEAPPGTTPVGSPAFASSRHSDIAPSNGGAPMGAVAPGQTSCPPGQTFVNGVCQPVPGSDPVGNAATFTASTSDPKRMLRIAAAKAELESEYGPHGYHVKQIKRSGDKIHALLSVR